MVESKTEHDTEIITDGVVGREVVKVEGPKPTAMEQVVEGVKTRLLDVIRPVLADRKARYEIEYGAVEAIRVIDPASEAAADTLLHQVLREKDGLEAVRVSGPGALGSLARALNAEFKPVADILTAAEAHLKKQIGNHKIAQRQQQEASYRAAAEHHKKGEHEKAAQNLVTASAAAALVEAPKGSSVREVWKVRVIDAEKLPREWMTPDTKRINAFARNHPTDREPKIEGVEFIKDTTMATRRKK